MDKCTGGGCKCPPGMVGTEPFCKYAKPGDITCGFVSDRLVGWFGVVQIWVVGVG